MAKTDNIELEGTVKEKIKGGKFIVAVKAGEVDKLVTCTVCGKINLNNIRIVAGDTVTIEVSPYNLSLGRIIWRDR